MMNKFKINMIFISLIGIGIVCLFAMAFTWYRKSSVVRDYQEIFKRRDRSIGSIKVAPTADNIFLIKKDYEWLTERSNDLKKVLDKKKLNIRDITPLQFKEELLSAQVKFKQLAGIQGCKLEESLGFPEYVSGEIPPQENVSLLSKQLNIINEITNIILKYKVSEVDSIVRSSDMYDGGNGLYKEMAFKFDVHCTIEELLGILKDIINAPYVLIVRDINIDKLNEDKVSAEILVGAVEIN